MEYNIEKILEMYEDDYNPSSTVPGPRKPFSYAGIVKQGPNTGKHKYLDFYSKKQAEELGKNTTTEWFNSKPKMDAALKKRKIESGKSLSQTEMTTKYKKFLKKEGFKTWAEAPDDAKSRMKTALYNEKNPRESIAKWKKEGLNKRLNEETRKLLEKKKPINPKTGLPYTLKEYTDLTPGQKTKLLSRLKGKFKSKTPKPRQGYYPEKDANKLINFLKIAADKQKKNNVPLKERTFINIFETVDDKNKFVGVRDVKANTLYTHIDYTGNKKGTSIADHPSQDEVLSFLKEAKKFKFEKPEKLLGSYFSEYQRVPTYNEIYNFFNRDRNAPLKSFKQNALEIHHRNLIQKVPDKNFQLVTMKKNTEANRILNLLNNKQITKQQADTALKKLGVNLEGMGKQDITTGKSLGSAKRETIKLFKDAYKKNPKIVEDIAQKLKILGCPKSLQKASGGRIKFSKGTSCEILGRKVLEQGLKNGFKNTDDMALAKGILKAGKGLKDIVSLRSLFGPAAAAFTVLAEAGFVGYDMLSSGKSFREAVGDSVFNYMLGDKTKIDSEEEFIKRLKNIKTGPMGYRDFSDEEIGKMQYFKEQLKDMNTGFDLYNQLENIDQKIEDNALNQAINPSFFSDTAFQLDAERDKIQAAIQDYNRTGTPKTVTDYLLSPKATEGADALAKAGLLARQDQLQDAGIGKFYQSPMGDEKRKKEAADIAFKINQMYNPTKLDEFGEYFISRPQSEQSYIMGLGYKEGGIASLNVNKK